MLASTAQRWTWASVRPGMSVCPLRSSVATCPLSGPTLPEGRTSLISPSSTITAAPSTGSLPVQSIRNALVRTVRPGISSSSARDHLRLEHPDLFVGARLPLDPGGHAVEIVLLPEEDPRHLVMDDLLDLGPRLEPPLRVHGDDRLGDLGLQRLFPALGWAGR